MNVKRRFTSGCWFPSFCAKEEKHPEQRQPTQKCDAAIIEFLSASLERLAIQRCRVGAAAGFVSGCQPYWLIFRAIGREDAKKFLQILADLPC